VGIIPGSSDEPVKVARNPPLTLERLYASPSISGPKVIGTKISPDGKRVTFLRGKESDQEQFDLWEYNIAAGELRELVDSEILVKAEDENLSEEEIGRRERQRLRGKGIIEYFWNEQGTALLFPLGGDLYYLPLEGDVQRLTSTEEFETDAQFSPLGNYVSFIRDRDLYAIELATGREIRVTTGASDTVAHGVAEFVVQEELDRYTGYWWSWDESKIAFTRIHESPLDLVHRYEGRTDGSVKTTPQRYPFAGSDNVLIQLGVVNLSDRSVSWLNLGEDKDIYLARVDWLRNNSTIAFQVLPRDQESLLLIFAAADGSGQKVVVRERCDIWINLHKDLRFLKNAEQFLWTSERTGYRHIYLYANDGTLLGSLTNGEWVVKEIVSVDEAAGLVYFTGFADNTLELHLYVASIDPKAKSMRRVTQEEGWHETAMKTDGGEVFVDAFSSGAQPPQMAIRSTKDGSTIAYISENPLDEEHPYWSYLSGHAKSQYGQISLESGVELDYVMLLPPGFDENKKYPAILAPYGGPHGHRVRKSWGVGFDEKGRGVGFNQILARNGFVVLTVDNRGSYNRGIEFEAPVKNAMGTVEIEDQVAGVEFLRKQPFIEGENIGIHGWSYGGYMTLMGLFKAPDHFKAGVAGAPVTDWRFYDTAYTERYLGHPEAEGDIYNKSSVFPYIDGFDRQKGKLLLIHGMADDNVFFDNSVKLMAEMQRRGVVFDLMTYPGQRHGFRDLEMRVHNRTLALEFLKRHLQN
jgi:dipeptidyl-peptidase-4